MRVTPTGLFLPIPRLNFYGGMQTAILSREVSYPASIQGFCTIYSLRYSDVWEIGIISPSPYLAITRYVHPVWMLGLLPGSCLLSVADIFVSTTAADRRAPYSTARYAHGFAPSCSDTQVEFVNVTSGYENSPVVAMIHKFYDKHL